MLTIKASSLLDVTQKGEYNKRKILKIFVNGLKYGLKPSNCLEWNIQIFAAIQYQ